MKKIFTLLTMALLAIGASAQTASDFYLDIAQYETIDLAGVNSSVTKMYSYKDDVLVVSVYGAQQSVYVDETDVTQGYQQKWVSYTAKGSTKYDGGWAASGVFNGSAYYGNSENRCAAVNTSRSTSFKITNCEKISVYANAWGSTNSVIMNVYELDATTLERTSSSAQTQSVSGKELKVMNIDGLSASKIYEVELTGGSTSNARALEIAFHKKGSGTVPQVVDPEFSLTNNTIYLDETSQIIITGKTGLDGLTMSGLSYDSSVITIDETGKITPVAAGTSTIKFTTDAVADKYNAGSASLSITVNEVPAAPEFGQWNFSDEAFSRYSSFTENVTVAGLTIHASSSKSLAIDTNSKTMDGYNFTHRLKLNGEGSEDGRYLSFEVSGPCTINVYGMAASSSATDRNLIVTSGSFGGTELYKAPILGDQLYKVTLKVTEATTIYVYSNNSINLYGIFVTTPLKRTEPTVWDFTQELSSADASNLEAADAWTFDNEKNYWKNSESLVTGRNVYTALEANGEELEIAKGLTFARDNNEGIAADRIMIAPAKYLAVNGSSMLINLGKLAKDDVIRMRIKGAGADERSLTPTNADVTEGSLTTSDTEVHEVSLIVPEDGSVTFKTTNGFQFLAIAINTALPEYTPTGISVINAETEGAADAPVYNLSGQRVDENYRGVVIKNGRKVVNK